MGPAAADAPLKQSALLAISRTVQSRPDTIQEVALIEWLGQIADDPGFKRAGSNIIARIRSYQHGGDRLAPERQVVVQIKASHVGHVKINNQAAGAVVVARSSAKLR